MDTALTQKFPFILDRNLAKANYTGNRVCTSCDTVVLDFPINAESTEAKVMRLFEQRVLKMTLLAQYFPIGPLLHSVVQVKLLAKKLSLELDADPQKGDDAFPISS